MERIGVVLLHRGDPFGPEAVKPFLRAYYADPLAHSLPVWSEMQKLWARIRAAEEHKRVAQALFELGGKSPLNHCVETLAHGLEAVLNGDNAGTAAAGFSVKTAYRYPSSGAAEVVKGLASEGIARVVGLSLYPQHSPALLASSATELQRACEDKHLSIVDRYATHPKYLEVVRASMDQALACFDGDEQPNVAVLFCALPVAAAHVRDGDPYPQQLSATVRAVTAQLPNPSMLCYLGDEAPRPSVEQALTILVQKNSKELLLVPLGTTVDEVSSLHPLEVVLRRRAKELGFRHVERAASPASATSFPQALGVLLREHLERLAALGL
ncbi:MAG: ferrochelatase [Myxococcota bacterium]